MSQYKVFPVLTDCLQARDIESGFKKLSAIEILPFLKGLGFNFKRVPKPGIYLLPDKTKLQSLLFQLDYKERVRMHACDDLLLLEHIRIERLQAQSEGEPS